MVNSAVTHGLGRRAIESTIAEATNPITNFDIVEFLTNGHYRANRWVAEGNLFHSFLHEINKQSGWPLSGLETELITNNEGNPEIPLQCIRRIDHRYYFSVEVRHHDRVQQQEFDYTVGLRLFHVAKEFRHFSAPIGEIRTQDPIPVTETRDSHFAMIYPYPAKYGKCDLSSQELIKLQRALYNAGSTKYLPDQLYALLYGEEHSAGELDSNGVISTRSALLPPLEVRDPAA